MAVDVASDLGPAATQVWCRGCLPAYRESVAAEVRSLAGTVVGITGASAGIGLAAARQLVEAGANVALGARRIDRLEALVAELGADRAVAVAMDVRQPADNVRLVNAAVQRWGRLDSIVPNAGIGLYGGIMDWDDDRLAEMLDTNLAGTVWSVRAAVPRFLEAGGGDVVIVASVAGLRGGGDEAVYASTKFGQVGLAGALDRELRVSGIRVSAICPAGVATEFAMGTGRLPDSPFLADFLQADDVAHAIVTVLQQPRRLRTTMWSMWSMGQQS